MRAYKIFDGTLYVSTRCEVVGSTISKNTKYVAVVAEKNDLMPPLVIGIDKPYMELSNREVDEVVLKACSINPDFLHLLLNSNRLNFGLFNCPMENDAFSDCGVFISAAAVKKE